MLRNGKLGSSHRYLISRCDVALLARRRQSARMRAPRSESWNCERRREHSALRRDSRCAISLFFSPKMAFPEVEQSVLNGNSFGVPTAENRENRRIGESRVATHVHNESRSSAIIANSNNFIIMILVLHVYR